MVFSEFLLERVGLTYGHFALHALDKLAGTSPFVSFYPGVLEGWAGAPVFFFPFAELDDDVYGLHLLPQRVAWERLVVAKADGSGVRDIAPTLAEFAYKELSCIEALYHEEEMDPAEHMHKAVEAVNEAFGPGFYRPGRRGPFITEDVDALDFTPQNGVMSVQISRTYECIGRGVIKRAARAFVRSMSCYHYTSGLVTPRCGRKPNRSALEAYLALGRELQSQVPNAFPDTLKRELTLDSDADRVQWMAELWKEGACAQSLKALCDLCYVRDAWEHPLTYKLLRAHFAELRMSWAAVLLDRRAPPQDRGEYDDLSVEMEKAWAVIA